MMRLRRLDLTRYGKFTDKVLDFGAPPVDGPDLHVVFGPNEAGKSTLLSAWMDLLYGIPARTSHDFIHPYASMRLGAALELPDGLHEVVRLKRNQNSLTDPQGRPLPESVLRAGLGGLDRAAYETMFSLDDDTLAEGGDSILSSKGDLGQLLFSASAGLAELGQRLDGLRVQADAFHKRRAQRTRLKELRDELQALADEAAELDTQAGDYVRLRQAAQAARADHDAALEDVARATGARDRLRGRQGALPLMAEWREVTAEVGPLEGLPEVPADWHTRIDPLIATDIRLRTETDLAARRAQELAAELAQTPGDPQALALADRAAAAAELRGRDRSARDDLPRQQQERDDLHRSIADLAAALGQPEEADPARLVPDAATLGTLDDLLAGWSGLAATLASATAEARDAAARLQDAGGALEEGNDSLTRRAQALRAALAPLRRADLAARLSDAEAERQDSGARLAEALTGLAPWRGDAAALAALPCPAADTLAVWRARLDQAAAARDDAARALRDHHAESRRRAAEAAALAADLGTADPAAAAAARAARDSAWGTHRLRLDVASADAFAAALDAHDAALAAQLARAADIGQLHRARQDADVADRLAADASADLAQAEDALALVRAELAGRIAAILPGADADSLPELAAWLPRRAQALDLARQQTAALRARDRAAADAAAAAVALREALETAGPADLPALAALAEAELERLETEASRLDLRRRLTQDRRVRAQAEAAARQAVEAWQADWAAAARETWLADLAQPPEPARMRAMLARMRELGRTLDAARALDHRIEAMQSDQARFAAAAQDLAAALDLTHDDPEQALDAVSARISVAQAAHKARDELARKQRDLKDSLGGLEAGRRALDAEARALCDRLSAPDLEAARTALLRLGRRDELRARAAALAARIRSDLNCDDMQAAAALLQGADAENTGVELARAAAELDLAQARLGEAQREMFAADHALAAVGADDRVAMIEARRRALALAIEEGARDWLRRRAGIMAADHALRHYRDIHRSGMLARASDAFAAMTGGAYAGLATQPAASGTGDVLVAQAADGTTRDTAALSKGTRFQLYLALRIGGFHEYAAAHGAVPIVADDVLETFDDDRTARALAALSDTAGTGQVIYLTHHRHVVELARAACPGARLHQL